MAESTRYVGTRRPRIDGREKVIGATRYAGDLTRPGLLHARVVGSIYAHARIRGVDAGAALAVPGVVAVLTAKDLPIVATGEERRFEPLAETEVVFAGQPVALVVASTETAAADATALVEIDAEPLPEVVDVLAAAEPNAPLSRAAPGRRRGGSDRGRRSRPRHRDRPRTGDRRGLRQRLQSPARTAWGSRCGACTMRRDRRRPFPRKLGAPVLHGAAGRHRLDRTGRHARACEQHAGDVLRPRRAGEDVRPAVIEGPGDRGGPRWRLRCEGHDRRAPGRGRGDAPASAGQAGPGPSRRFRGHEPRAGHPHRPPDRCTAVGPVRGARSAPDLRRGGVRRSGPGSGSPRELDQRALPLARLRRPGLRRPHEPVPARATIGRRRVRRASSRSNRSSTSSSERLETRSGRRPRGEPRRGRRPDGGRHAVAEDRRDRVPRHDCARHPMWTGRRDLPAGEGVGLAIGVWLGAKEPAAAVVPSRGGRHDHGHHRRRRHERSDEWVCRRSRPRRSACPWRRSPSSPPTRAPPRRRRPATPAPSRTAPGSAVQRAVADARDRLLRIAADDFEIEPDDLEIVDGIVRPGVRRISGVRSPSSRSRSARPWGRSTAGRRARRHRAHGPRAIGRRPSCRTSASTGRPDRWSCSATPSSRTSAGRSIPRWSKARCWAGRSSRSAWRSTRSSSTTITGNC